MEKVGVPSQFVCGRIIESLDVSVVSGMHVISREEPMLEGRAYMTDRIESEIPIWILDTFVNDRLRRINPDDYVPNWSYQETIDSLCCSLLRDLPNIKSIELSRKFISLDVCYGTRLIDGTTELVRLSPYEGRTNTCTYTLFAEFTPEASGPNNKQAMVQLALENNSKEELAVALLRYLREKMPGLSYTCLHGNIPDILTLEGLAE